MFHETVQKSCKGKLAQPTFIFNPDQFCYSLFIGQGFSELPRVAIFSLPKRKTFFGNNYYQLYKLFCKAGKIFLDICWTLTAFGNYILIIICTNTAVCFLNLLCQ